VNINDAFPSAYLRAADLQGRTVRVVIASVELADMDDGRKPVLTFQGKDRGLVLNKVNAMTISAAYGDETDRWIGRPLELFVMKVQFGGRLVDGLRVRIPEGQAAAPPPAPEPVPAAPAPGQDDGAPFNDDIPF